MYYLPGKATSPFRRRHFPKVRCHFPRWVSSPCSKAATYLESILSRALRSQFFTLHIMLSAFQKIHPSKQKHGETKTLDIKLYFLIIPCIFHYISPCILPFGKKKNFPFQLAIGFCQIGKNPKKTSTKPRNPWPFQQALLLWSNPWFFSPI